jgi:hypothetical protein
VATTFDVVTDFNNTGTQPKAGDPFTYGTETSLNTGFTLFPNFQANGTVSVGGGVSTTDGTLANYYISEAISGPCVGEVATGGPLSFGGGAFIVPNDVLMMAPGDPPNEITVTRFTAPDKAIFDITGSFINLQQATVSVAVLVNGTTEFSGVFSGGSGGTLPFSINDVLLQPGATVDFIVDSLGNRGDDVLGLKAQITELPVPIMLDAIAGSKFTFTTLSGTAEANSSVSILDGGKPVGTVTAAADGTWSLQVELSGKGKTIHSFTETSTDGTHTISSGGVTLFAQATNQSLVGGSVDDVLIGGQNDTLAGGGGSDTFVFNPGFGKNTITDFTSQDVIAFDHTLFTHATAAQVLSQTQDTKAGAVIVVDAHDTVTLTGVHPAQLQSSNFLFF